MCCSICKKTMPDFGVKHTEELCPLRNSSYCAYCADYGHLTKECPAKPRRIFREPAFVEQLIPPTMLQEYNITTLTPITYDRPDTPPQLVEIKDDDRVITAYILAQSIKVPKGYTKKQAVEQDAKLRNRRVVYLAS